ncbi:MAG TPA: nickel pincer cofactor biosynthesis protein LarC [Polyangia bacterium]
MSKALHGLHLHLEPTSGIAGDMAVAALVDAGVPAAVVREAVARMGVRGLKVGFETRQRGAFVGRGFVVDWPGAEKKPRPKKHAATKTHDHDHHHDHSVDHDHDHDHDHDLDHHHEPAHDHRDYAEIRALIKRAKLDADVAALAGDIFARVAEVEAALHGSSVDRVTFHEVGAYDSIADIVGVAAAIVWLRPASIGALPPVVGTGSVHTAHGLVPVPAPATAALLRGMPMRFEGAGELTTPTGAAILAATVDSFGPPPPMRLFSVGYGAGTRELADRPNVLRALLGEPLGQVDAAAPSALTLLEANLDDMNPQLLSPLYDALLAAGAVDVWSAPILMKKGRPATTVSALVPPAALVEAERAFFLNSTTLGLRVRPVDRVTLARSFATVQTPFGAVKIKLGSLDGAVIGAQPEFEDCRRAAASAKVPVRAVLAAAAAEAERWLRGKGAARQPARRR